MYPLDIVKFKLLNEANFIENKNSKLSKKQLETLNKLIPGRQSLLMFALVMVMFGAGVFSIVDQAYQAGTLIGFLSLSLACAFFFYHQYYYPILSDMRANNIAFAVGKIDYQTRRFVIQSDEISLPLPFELQEGLTAGTYEVFYLPSPKLLISARLKGDMTASQRARELTDLLGKAFRFSAEELEANRFGDIPDSQKMKILKMSVVELLNALIPILILALNGILFGYMAISFENMGVLFGCLTLISFAIVLFLYVKFKPLEKFQEALKPVLKTVDGICSLRVETHNYTDPKGWNRFSEHHFFVVKKTTLDVRQAQFTKLVDDVHLRVFYTRLGKHPISMEVVSLGNKNADES